MVELALLVFVLLSAVAIHEGGHAVVFAVLGFRIQTFAVWPIQLERTRTGWKISPMRITHKGTRGMVRAIPLHAKNLRARTIAGTAAGPAFSLGAAALFLWIASSWLPKSAEQTSTLLSWAAVVSFFTGLISLIPARRTDGRKILDLVSGRSGFLRGLAITSLASSANHQRPKDWDAGLMSLAANGSIDIDGDQEKITSITRWLSYYWHADSGRVALAEQELVFVAFPKGRGNRPPARGLGGRLV